MFESPRARRRNPAYAGGFVASTSGGLAAVVTIVPSSGAILHRSDRVASEARPLIPALRNEIRQIDLLTFGGCLGPAMFHESRATRRVRATGETVVIRIDPQTRRIRDVIEVGSGGQLLAADGVIWVAAGNGTVTQVDEG